MEEILIRGLQYTGKKIIENNFFPFNLSYNLKLESLELKVLQALFFYYFFF